ncbi:MAG TPA: HEAT repeat domain-containing protein, partial [Isosphaeraceae bacterium]
MTIVSLREASSDRPDSPWRGSTVGRTGSFGMEIGFLRLAIVLAASLQASAAVRADEPAGRGGPVELRVSALKGPDAKSRAEAAQELEVMGPRAKAAAPALVEALRDRDAMVRIRAASALSRVGGPLESALPVLLTARNDPDDEVRAEAESAWGRIGPGVRSTLPYLLESLRRADPQAQRKAVVALGKNGLEAVPALVDVLALEHAMISAPGGIMITQPAAFGGFPRYSSENGAQIQANTRLRALAVETLGKLGPGVLPTVLEASRGPDASVREGAAQILGLLGPDAGGGIVPALVRGVRDRDAWVRQRSVEALAKAGKSSPAALEALVEALGHKDTMVRRTVVQALAPPGAVRGMNVPVMSGAMSATGMTRPAAAQASAPTGVGLAQPSAVPALIAALDDPDSFVRQKAAEALAKISPPVKECLPALVDHLTDRDYNIRQMAGQTLEGLGPRAKEAAPALRGLLKARDPFVRVIAARALGRTGPEGVSLALPALREALDEEDMSSRLKAAESLWDLGHAGDAIPVLVAALGARDGYNSRNQASQILQRIGPGNKDAIPALIDALKDGDPNTRNQVLQILQRMGPTAREAAPDIVELVTSKDQGLRMQALQVLRQ